jgi:excisionase family DNA binding protein
MDTTPTPRNSPKPPSALAEADADADADDRLFLTVEEVGRRLGVRRSRVYELAASGLLPVVRMGRRLRFPRRGLDDLAEEAITRARSVLPDGYGPGTR